MNLRFGVIIGVILVAAGMRLALSGVPNVSPVTALALFSGALLADRRLALMIPLLAMVCGDLVLGLHSTLAFVYASFVLVGLLGMALAGRLCGRAVIAASLFSSLLFFVVTNFGVWLVAGYYPLTLDGLIACFVAAVPFFHYTLLGDLLFAGLMFGGFRLLEGRVPALRRDLHRGHGVSA